MSEVLYRKWRPQSFSEVHGQDAVTRTIRNSVASGRLAHAYLFCGPRGTGKTTIGRLLAKAANCADQKDGEPCNECESCRAFIEGRAIDFIEQDAASQSRVEDIRQLRENVALTPMSAERKVYLLDEVHMLSNSAQNALLKTLEEPPPHIIFVLATTEAHKVQSTIASRCQRFDLKRIPVAAIVDRLSHICTEEGFEIERESLDEIARSATGSLRDAINSLEQVVTYYGTSPSDEQVREALGLSVDARSGQLARAAMAGDLAESLRTIAAVRDDGTDMKQYSKQVLMYLRGLLLAKAGASEALELPQEMAAEVKDEAAKLPREDIIAALSAFGRIDWKDEGQSSLPLELALVEFISGRGGRAEPAPQREQPARPSPAAARPEPAPRPAPKPEPKREPAPAAEPEPVAASNGSPVVEPTPEPEPEPAPAAVPKPVPSGEGDVLDRVRLALKDTDKQLSALLNGSCELKSAEGDSVVLGFYHTFHLERVEGGGFRPRLEEAFSAELGRKVNVVFEHAPRASRGSEDEKPKGGHLVQAARELGARAVPSDEA